MEKTRQIENRSVLCRKCWESWEFLGNHVRNIENFGKTWETWGLVGVKPDALLSNWQIIQYVGKLEKVGEILRVMEIPGQTFGDLSESLRQSIFEIEEYLFIR